MAERKVFSDMTGLAEAAVQAVVADLKRSIAIHGQAVWVIAGGTSPMVAYRRLAETAVRALDWSKVIIVIGDERCVPFDSPDCNWAQADAAFLSQVRLSTMTVRPQSDRAPEVAAAAYEAWLRRLPQAAGGMPRLDHVWLGVGEDGHTLSLFPGHPISEPADHLVVAVHDSPKPPPNRISLTFHALQGAANCLIMAAGQGKAPVIARALDGDQSLPVAKAAATVESSGGRVTWLLDEAAAGVS